MRLGLYLTYTCNQRCSYCFKENVPGKMISEEDFDIFCEWARKARPDDICLAGGEPTLHPNFVEFTHQARRRVRRKVAVISNLLCDEGQLEGFNHCNVLVNTSPPHTRQERALFEENLGRVVAAPGTRVTLSRTIDSSCADDATYLPYLCREFNIAFARVDFSRASLLRKNTHFTLEVARARKDEVVAWARSLHEQGVRVGFDCPLPEELFSRQELALFGNEDAAVVNAARFACVMLYINPDLTISSCPFRVIDERRLDVFPDMETLAVTVGRKVQMKLEKEGRKGKFLCMAERFMVAS